MQSTLNTELLAGMLKGKRGKKGLRAISVECDISSATLSRIEQGKIPDVETYIKLCKWLEVSTETFIKSGNSTTPVSSKQHVLAHLRADRELPQETLNMLLKMIDLAYASK
jgi:transcriptional regulator with XRE-family HTH domain